MRVQEGGGGGNGSSKGKEVLSVPHNKKHETLMGHVMATIDSW